MVFEIERKFLVKGNEWRGLASGRAYRQGYLSTDNERAVRVRTIGSQGFLTIKGMSIGITRVEYEYEIPLSEADDMLDSFCLRPLIEKKRHKILYEGLIWEVDEFVGINQGLIIAEVELETDGQEFVLPDWIGQEVTSDQRYYNANLVAAPFTTWKAL